MADFTDALVPSTGTMLRRLAADEDQLALLQRILDGWPRRQALAVTRDVMTEWSRDEGSAQAIETAVRQQLAEAAAIRGGLGSILFGVQVTWHDKGDRAARLDRPTLLLPTPVPRQLFVMASGTVIPAPLEDS